MLWQTELSSGKNNTLSSEELGFCYLLVLIKDKWYSLSYKHLDIKSYNQCIFLNEN